MVVGMSSFVKPLVLLEVRVLRVEAKPTCIGPCVSANQYPVKPKQTLSDFRFVIYAKYRVAGFFEIIAG